MTALVAAAATAALPGETMTPCPSEPLSLHRHRSLLDEQRARAGGIPDFQDHFPVVTAGPGLIPAEVVAHRTVGGHPLVWLEEDGARAVVDARVFATDLEMADVTAMPGGATVTVGRLHPGLEIVPGDLVRCLLEARIIATWIHIGAELCPLSEEDDGTRFRISFRGHHTFFTNEENVVPLAFTVTVDRASGEIAVTRR